MAVCNSAEFVAPSIKCILSQTFKDFEFLVIDDGSTDRTEEVIAGFRDPRLVYKKREHKGISSALNYGLSLASGGWVARIDPGDLSVPSRLQKQAEFILNNPGVDIISSWSVYFREPRRVLFFSKEPVEHKQIYDTLNLRNPIISSGTIYRKNTVRKARYNEKLSEFQDFELYFRIRDEVRFANVPEFLTYTKMRTRPRTKAEDKEAVYEILNDFAMRQLINSVRKRDQFYWTTIAAKQNYIYGHREKSRSYFRRFSNMKYIVRYMATFLPEAVFSYYLDNRVRSRLRDILKRKKYFKQELKQLLQ